MFLELLNPVFVSKQRITMSNRTEYQSSDFIPTNLKLITSNSHLNEVNSQWTVFIIVFYLLCAALMNQKAFKRNEKLVNIFTTKFIYHLNESGKKLMRKKVNKNCCMKLKSVNMKKKKVWVFGLTKLKLMLQTVYLCKLGPRKSCWVIDKTFVRKMNAWKKMCVVKIADV